MIRQRLLKGFFFVSLFILVGIGSTFNSLETSVSITSSDILRQTTVPGSSDPNQDEWPMFHGQLNHTGVAYTNPKFGTTRFWDYYTGDRVDSSPVVVGGRVYVGSWNGNLYCLNATTGGFLWSYATGSTIYASPAVADGRVYIGNLNGDIYCLNAITGGHIWNNSTGNDIDNSPAIADGRIYFGNYDGYIYCLNATTGEFLWNYLFNYNGTSSPAVANGRVYIGSYDHNVYCLNATTGEQIWNYTTNNEVHSSPAVADGCVYIGSHDNHVYCLNATTGKQIWNYTTGNQVGSSPAVSGGRLFVGSTDNYIYCLNATTGEFIWKYFAWGWVTSSPAVANGRLYFGSWDYNIYCLNATTSQFLWKYTTGNIIRSSPAIASGCVFVGSRDYRIYCLPSVIDTIPPIYASVTESADPLELGSTEIVTITGVSDNYGIQTVQIEFEGANHTMTDLGGGTWRYNTWMPSSEGTYPYTIYIQDLAGNWNSTAGTIQVLDTTPPTYASVSESADPLELGSTETITITGVADISGIQTVQIEFEGDNHTMTDLGGGTWRYNTWTPSNEGTYPYTIYIQDTTGNWNATSGAVQVNDTTPPTYTSVTESADPLELGSTEMITITGVADISGIQMVLIEFEGDNHTMTDLGGGTWRYTNWTPSSEGTYPYTIYIQDLAGNWKYVSGSIDVNKTTDETTAISGFLFPLVLFSIFIISRVSFWKRRTKF